MSEERSDTTVGCSKKSYAILENLEALSGMSKRQFIDKLCVILEELQNADAKCASHIDIVFLKRKSLAVTVVLIPSFQCYSEVPNNLEDLTGIATYTGEEEKK